MATWNDISAPVFNIGFDYDIGVSSLTADFSNLMGADDPSLSVVIPWRDCWAEIMDLVPETGGQVVWLDGEYVYTKTMEITRNNIHISGMGESTIFELKDETGAEVLGFYALSKAGLKVANLVIDGKKGENEPGTHRGINFVSCVDFEVKGVVTKNFNNSGIYAFDAYSCAIVENITINNSYGITIRGSSLGLADSLISGNVIQHNSGSGIRLVKGNNLAISSNMSRDNGGYGLWLEEIRESAITGNVTKGAGKLSGGNYNGIVMDDCHKNSVSGNSCSENNLHGIQVRTGSSQNIFSSNTCENNGEVGIFLSAYSSGSSIISEEWKSIRNTVNDNQCNGNGFHGISVLGDFNNVQNNTCFGNEFYGIRIHVSGDVVSQKNILSSNDLYGNGVGPYWDDGTDTEIDPGNRG